MNWLTDSQCSAIRKAATCKPTEETCGFVLADGSVIDVPNVAADRTELFVISPADYAQHEEQIVGIWHSHLTLAGFSPLDQQVMSADILPWAVYCMADDSFHQCEPEAAAPLEGRPFVFGVYDCYSLITDKLAELQVKLPAWPRGDWGEWNTPAFRPFDEQWSAIGRPVFDGKYQEGDLLLMNLGDHVGHTDHVGVFLNHREFLHHPANHLSRRQIFGSYWNKRLNWVIRPHALWTKYER
jgi:proteasome lid subunit RPN8/RPN11